MDLTIIGLKQLYHPHIFLILETKADSSRINGLKNLLGFPFCYAVSSVRKSRGLALFWDKYIDLNLISCSSGHLDVVISFKLMTFLCNATLLPSTGIPLLRVELTLGNYSNELVLIVMLLGFVVKILTKSYFNWISSYFIGRSRVC